VEAVDRKVEALDRKVVLLDEKVVALDKRVAVLDERVTGIDAKFDRSDKRTVYAEQRFDKMFLWLMGIQLTTLVTIVGGLFGIVTKLL
jgi:hypothetical protein